GQRAPNRYIEAIVKAGIPAFLIGGWFYLFQRGEPLNYSFFQNAYDGRSMEAPMSPTRTVTPPYQLLIRPWYHGSKGEGLDYEGLDLNGMQIAWYAYWLKGIDPGIVDTTTPLHLEDLGTGKYVEASRYPLNQATDSTYYLQSAGGLSPRKPTA